MSAWLGGRRSYRRVGLVLLFMGGVLAIPLALTFLAAIQSPSTGVSGALGLAGTILWVVGAYRLMRRGTKAPVLVGLGLLVAAYVVPMVTIPGAEGAYVPFVVYLLLCTATGAAAR